MAAAYCVERTYWTSYRDGTVVGYEGWDGELCGAFYITAVGGKGGGVVERDLLALVKGVDGGGGVSWIVCFGRQNSCDEHMTIWTEIVRRGYKFGFRRGWRHVVWLGVIEMKEFSKQRNWEADMLAALDSGLLWRDLIYSAEVNPPVKIMILEIDG